MLVRLLVKEGACVRVIMTCAAKDFITPLTLATLSKNHILVENFDPENGAWNSHISLGEWADLYLIAPATANTIAKMATGVGDSLLLTTYLSARCPVMVAPAMDFDMYLHTATQKNIEALRNLGVGIIEPESGELASGLSGKGRMAEPEEIVRIVTKDFAQRQKLAGKSFLVTAGATVEAIDPVRFISNYSTGKMGYAIADELALRGAQVTLVSGAATAKLATGTINLINVRSAAQMYDAVAKEFNDTDCAVFCAAVSDYTPDAPAKSKIKHDGELKLTLSPTKDIAAGMGKIKRPSQLTIGFALETDNELENAHKKLQTKNLDAIILNSLQDDGAGFGGDTNKITLISAGDTAIDYTLKPKTEVAADIVDWICWRMLGK